MENKQEKVLSNFAWKFAERCGAQGVSFLVSIVLARLLEPSVYGLIALVAVFTTILQVFVEGGFGSALVQKKDADELDFSSVFWFNIFACLLLYFILFLCAPLIARFYNNTELIPVIRVLGLVVVISGVKNIQQAYVSRNLIFKKFFFATLGGTIGAAIVGIYLAYKGYGVWALVVQNLFNQTIDTLILWIVVKWRPKMQFSIKRLKALLSYGWKLLASNLLDTVYVELRSLIIGKRYSSSDLAYYDEGKKFPSTLVSNINTAINSVLLPTMSKAQDDRALVKSMTRRSLKTSTFIMMPMMAGLAACATPLVSLLLTDKWLPCVPFLRVFCFTYAFYPVHTSNLNAMKAMGRSDIFLKLEIIKKAIGLSVLLISMHFGVLVIAYSLLLTSIASQIINSWPNKKLLDYSYKDQLLDMLPQICLSIFMLGAVMSIQLIGLPPLFTLLIQVPLGILIYVLGAKLLKIDSYDYCMSIVKNHLPKKHTK